MKKRFISILTLLFLVSIAISGCKKEETEPVAAPETVTEDAVAKKELLYQPMVGNPVAEETPADQAESIEAPVYWTELYDYNLNQQVLAQDGEFKNLTIQPGDAPDELRITWFSKSGAPGKVTFDTNGILGDVSAKATTEPSISVPGYYRNTAVIKGLQSNRTYSYTLKNKGKKSPIYKYTTQDLDSTDFTFTVAGDPELGLGDPEVLPGHRDMWRTVLNRMKTDIPDSSFLITMGDQIGDPASSIQYDYFLDNSVLYSTPLVPVVGNHDVGTGFFGDHFSLPNESPIGTAQGRDGDYWFVKGNALFMVLNSLTVQPVECHEQFVAETIAKNPDAKWRIIISHYSPATMVERYLGVRESIKYAYAHLAQNYDIDIFFGGHDHIYTRSYFLDGNGDPLPGQQVQYEFHNPEQPFYVIFNSSTNALYRQPEDYPWAAVTIQHAVPQLSEVHITENSMTVSTYNVDTWAMADSFTIYKD